jgi:hypothetical protein
MTKLLRVLAPICVFLAAIGIETAAAAPVGKAVRATQTVKANGDVGSRVVNANSDVFFLDRISTDAAGIGEFVFTDGTKLALGNSASVVVDQYVLKDKNSFQKLGISAAKGTFRWISGKSASAAYKIKTPRGTMGIRGTAFDLTIRNGIVYIALISGSAQLCNGSVCRTLTRSCDYIVANGRSISDPKPVGAAFTSRAAAAKLFPYLAGPGQLSSRFHIGGSRCLTIASIIKPGDSPNPIANTPPPAPAPAPPNNDPPPGGDDDGDDGECGKGCD